MLISKSNSCWHLKHLDKLLTTIFKEQLYLKIIFVPKWLHDFTEFIILILDFFYLVNDVLVRTKLVNGDRRTGLMAHAGLTCLNLVIAGQKEEAMRSQSSLISKYTKVFVSC